MAAGGRVSPKSETMSALECQHRKSAKVRRQSGRNRATAQRKGGESFWRLFVVYELA
jgi:hypothetical protein